MYAFCIGMDLSGNNKGKEICYVHKEYICQRISDEQIVLCRICTDADSAYGNKDQTCKAENQRDCRDQGQEVCGILLLYLQGAKITYAYTVFLVFMLLSVLAGSVEAALLGVIFSVLVVMYIDLSLQDKLTARRQEILMDLPQVLSKLTLLVNSGMVLRDAWKRTAITGERALYKEMQNTSLEIDNGIMEADAYRNFADRCSVKEVRKFTSLILQNLQKGNEELALFLGDMSTEMWEMKKNEVKQKGEKANSRLLLPVFLIFIGILILILVPVMSGLG